MIEKIIAVLFAVFFVEIILQKKWIAIMHRKKIEQVAKLYGPSWHEKTKTGTPTMGGVVFIPAFLVTVPFVLLFCGTESCEVTLKILFYPIISAFVGLIDDVLKYKKHSSDGLKSLQKLWLQIITTLIWAFWISEPSNSILPYFSLSRIPFILLITFVGVGLQNAVNVTDGLDGLCTGCSLISFVSAFFLLNLSEPLILYNIAACAVCLGFLWHNSNKASVFMGDVGAHFFAGLILSLCVLSKNTITVIPMGFFFGIEILSVSIQIVAIRRFKRKVFKMSPIHHHFELSGWTENQIVVRFWIMHIMGIAALSALLKLIIG